MPAKQLKMSLLQVFSEMTTQRNGFGQNSCAADQQACVFGSCECNEHSTMSLCFKKFYDKWPKFSDYVIYKLVTK